MSTRTTEQTGRLVLTVTLENGEPATREKAEATLGTAEHVLRSLGLEPQRVESTPAADGVTRWVALYAKPSTRRVMLSAWLRMIADDPAYFGAADALLSASRFLVLDETAEVPA